MSSSNCCFLTCIQISQGADKVVWYSYLFKNSPQFVVIHTVKTFGIVNEAEIEFFWNSVAFSMSQRMLAIWSLVPLPFLNSAWTSGNSQFTYGWSLAWRSLSITLLACEMSAIVRSSNFIIILLGTFFVVKKIRWQTAACGLHRLCFNIRLQRSSFSSTRRQELSQIEQILVEQAKLTLLYSFTVS